MSKHSPMTMREYDLGDGQKFCSLYRNGHESVADSFSVEDAKYFLRLNNLQPKIEALLGTVSRVFSGTYQGDEAKRLLKEIGGE